MCACYLKDNFHDIWFHVPIKAVIVPFCYHFCNVTCTARNVKSSLSYYNWHAPYMEFMIPDVFILWHVFQTDTALSLQHIKRIASRFSKGEITPPPSKQNFAHVHLCLCWMITPSVRKTAEILNGPAVKNRISTDEKHEIWMCITVQLSF